MGSLQVNYSVPNWTKSKADVPTSKLVFKDMAYKKTHSRDFRQQLEKSLPVSKRKQPGKWSEYFDAALKSSVVNSSVKGSS